MTKVINFYGGPGAGKSTMAAQLFGEMKRRQMNVEFAPEFAKELTWQKSLSLDDQVFVLGNQHHRLYTLLDQVDYIITDSPLLLSLYYIEDSLRKLNDGTGVKWSVKMLVSDLYRQYDNRDYVVVRGDREYLTAGRNQTLDEAKAIDNGVIAILDNYNISYVTVTKFEEVLESLLGSK